MDLVEVAAIGTAIGTGAGAAWAAFKRFARRKYQRSHDVGQAIRAHSDLYAELTRILKTTSAERVLLLKVHNGGRVIEKPVTQLYITIFAELTPGQIDSVQEDFQGEPLYCPYYIAMLRNVWAKKSIKITTTNMPKESMLRGVYESAGVATSVVTECLSEPGAYWYISTSWSASHVVDGVDKARIAGPVGNVRRIIQRGLFT